MFTIEGRGTVVTGRVDRGVLPLGNAGVAQPGDRTRVRFRLQHAVGIEPGMRFALREGKKTVGAGVVTAVL